MEGYPFAVSKPLEPDTNYDPAKAQKLLAQAGYPNGKGFPTVTFSYPAGIGALDTTTTGLVVQALAQNWNQVLFGGGSTLLLQELDNSTFYKKMEALPTQIEMGAVSYGMDYFDASNMLSVYKAGGRHDWDNAHYDNLLAQGAAQFNNSKRQEIYTEAQTLLTYACARRVHFPRPRRVPDVAVPARAGAGQELPRLQRPPVAGLLPLLHLPAGALYRQQRPPVPPPERELSKRRNARALPGLGSAVIVRPGLHTTGDRRGGARPPRS